MSLAALCWSHALHVNATSSLGVMGGRAGSIGRVQYG
jgi:hypothetical protein